MSRKSKLSFALMALAMFVIGVSVIFNAGSAQAASANGNKVVKTTVRLRKATEIGNTTLPPGQYRVKVTPASDGSGDPTIQFSVFYNPYGNEGFPPYEEEILLTVKASTRDLGAPAARTELSHASVDSGPGASLEIRGNSTEYILGATTTSAANNQ